MHRICAKKLFGKKKVGYHTETGKVILSGLNDPK